MPTFAEQEASKYLGSPVEIYHLVYGTTEGANLRWNDGPVALTVGGETFPPQAGVKRTSAKIKGTGEENGISLKLSASSELTGLFFPYPPIQLVSIVVRQGHMPDDPGADVADELFPPVWTGNVSEVRREGSEIVLELKSPVSELKRPGLRRNYQFSCTHDLYGRRCRANRALATTVAQVTETTAGDIAFADTSWRLIGVENADYLGGYIEWTTDRGVERAGIRTVDDLRLGLTGRFDTLAANDNVNIVLGCARTLQACAALHNNVANFGGMPWIPDENPLNAKIYG